MKSENIRMIGLFLAIFGMAFFSLVIGTFWKYQAISNLLALVFLAGMFTSLGIAMITMFDKEERKFYRARKKREHQAKLEKLMQEIEYAKEKAEAN